MKKTASNEELIERIRLGDEEAKSCLVQQNSVLVYSVIRWFSRQRVSNEDLFQVGCVDLMRTLNNFDTNYEVKFSTCAVPVIVREIKRFFRDDGSIRISRSLKEGYL